MSQKKKVLIIDDEVDLCLLLKTYLNRRNYEVYYSHTLKEGIRQFKQVEPDILFLDNNLPDGKGIDFLIHSKKEIPVDHVILISADPSEQLKQKALDAGVLFLEKPFGLNRIREMIKEIS